MEDQLDPFFFKKKAVTKQGSDWTIHKDKSGTFTNRISGLGFSLMHNAFVGQIY